MLASAMLMAGGRGERMRRSGVDIPKPLVPVAGVPLAERNVVVLLRQPLRELVVAVPAGEEEVVAFAAGRLAELAADAGVDYRVLVEEVPLGNIGCAGMMRESADALILAFADNLTTLNLGAFLQFHHAHDAAMTLAAHDQPFPLPFGQLDLDGSQVLAYSEKPTLHVTVCSGLAVLGPAAMARLPADRPTGMSDLASQLVRAEERVVAFRHASDWVDVNDAPSLERAELLVKNNAWFFDSALPDGPEHPVGERGRT